MCILLLKNIIIIYCFLSLQLSRVLLRLLKHQHLFSFKSKLIECIKALDSLNEELIPGALIFIMDIWKSHNVKTIVLLRTMIELYDWCNKEKWMKLQLSVVSHLSKFFSDYDFQLAEESMNFWIRILHENLKYWQEKTDNIRVVVNALKKVKSNVVNLPNVLSRFQRCACHHIVLIGGCNN